MSVNKHTNSLLELLGMSVSSSCSWILLSSSDVNRHLSSAAAGGGAELLFALSKGEEHEAGMEPVVIPSGNL